MLRATICMILMVLLSLNTLVSQTKQHQTDSIQTDKNSITILPHFLQASYSGGASAWQKHIRDKIAPLTPPCEEGKVFVSFKVLASGKLDSVQVYRGLCEMADKNAVEIVQTSGRWTPEYSEGKPIDSRMGIYIIYRYKRR